MTQSNAIRILSVEDHPVFREGLSTIIGSEADMMMVAQAANAEQAISEFRLHRPEITLMDLRLPGTNGTDALITIRGEFPYARIIMLSTSETDGEIQRAMRSGASAYLMKSMPTTEMLAVIRSVHAGRKHVPNEVAARLAEHLGDVMAHVIGRRLVLKRLSPAPRRAPLVLFHRTEFTAPFEASSHS